MAHSYLQWHCAIISAVFQGKHHLLLLLLMCKIRDSDKHMSIKVLS